MLHVENTMANWTREVLPWNGPRCALPTVRRGPTVVRMLRWAISSVQCIHFACFSYDCLQRISTTARTTCLDQSSGVSLLLVWFAFSRSLSVTNWRWWPSLHVFLRPSLYYTPDSRPSVERGWARFEPRRLQKIWWDLNKIADEPSDDPVPHASDSTRQRNGGNWPNATRALAEGSSARLRRLFSGAHLPATTWSMEEREARVDPTPRSTCQDDRGIPDNRPCVEKWLGRTIDWVKPERWPTTCKSSFLLFFP